MITTPRFPLKSPLILGFGPRPIVPPVGRRLAAGPAQVSQQAGKPEASHGSQTTAGGIPSGQPWTCSARHCRNPDCILRRRRFSCKRCSKGAENAPGPPRPCKRDKEKWQGKPVKEGDLGMSTCPWALVVSERRVTGHFSYSPFPRWDA